MDRGKSRRRHTWFWNVYSRQLAGPWCWGSDRSRPQSCMHGMCYSCIHMFNAFRGMITRSPKTLLCHATIVILAIVIMSLLQCRHFHSRWYEFSFLAQLFNKITPFEHCCNAVCDSYPLSHSTAASFRTAFFTEVMATFIIKSIWCFKVPSSLLSYIHKRQEVV